MSDSIEDTVLGPLTSLTGASVGVDNNRISHGLRLNISARDAEGKRVRVEVEVPADRVPGLMVAIVNHGGGILAEIADAWRMGDCATCNNVRMVNEKRKHGSDWQVHCPDCGPAGGALTGYPVPHREGEPSRAGGEKG